MSGSVFRSALVLGMTATLGAFACRAARVEVATNCPTAPSASVRAARPKRLLAIGPSAVCIAGDGPQVLCSAHPGGTGWVRNDKGQLAVVPELEGAVQLAFTMESTCARMANESVRCWGVDAGGSLANGRTPTGPSHGGGEDCPMVNFSGNAPATYGTGPTPSLGDTSHLPPPPPFTPGPYDFYPVVTKPTPVLDISDAVELVAGTGGYCVRSKSGVVSCWGDSIGCHRATGWAVAASVPIPLKGLPPIRALASFDVLVANDGTLHHWIPADVTGPEQYPRFSSRKIAAPPGAEQIVWFYDSGYARMPDGTVECIGSKTSGACGKATNKTIDTSPWLVEDLSHVIDLTIGARSACALLDDGTARCWGADYVGQLGNGVVGEWAVPLPVLKLDEIAQIVAGGGTTCAVRDDGSLWCWGQLPDGTITPVPRRWWTPRPPS